MAWLLIGASNAEFRTYVLCCQVTLPSIVEDTAAPPSTTQLPSGRTTRMFDYFGVGDVAVQPHARLASAAAPRVLASTSAIAAVGNPNRLAFRLDSS